MAVRDSCVFFCMGTWFSGGRERVYPYMSRSKGTLVVSREQALAYPWRLPVSARDTDL
jgi:hypothetical protein